MLRYYYVECVGTTNLGIQYSKMNTVENDELIGYCDSDFAGNMVTEKHNRIHIFLWKWSNKVFTQTTHSITINRSGIYSCCRVLQRIHIVTKYFENLNQ